jgi:hypothetical protein
MNKLAYIIIVAALLINNRSSVAYHPSTHQALSEQAASRSVLGSLPQLNDLGLIYKFDDDKRRQIFANSNDAPLNIRDLIRSGASQEDEPLNPADDALLGRPLNHFFNPLTENGLSVHVITIAGFPFVDWAFFSSPTWALEDSASDIQASSTNPPQRFSLHDARGYLDEALTNISQAERRKNFGLLFQTFGHVIHHVQDMTQPQHVRNDMHCDDWKCVLIASYHPSSYEEYGKNRNNSLPFGSYPEVYSSADPTTFRKARSFWHTNGCSNNSCKGIADYTNRGFFSLGTVQSTDFPAPAVNFGGLVDENGDSVRNGVPVHGIRTYLSTQVHDGYTGITETNSRALAVAAFHSDAIEHGYAPRYILDDDDVYASTLNFLVPRAVGYSAGLINFFFRGKLEISLPDQGAYAILDHAKMFTVTDPTLKGFGEIKLKVKNTTPSSIPGSSDPEVMLGSTLRAVVKFHRNLCYQDDLANVPTAENEEDDREACRSRAEEIVVSEPHESVNLGKDDQEFTFQFQNYIPIDAIDIYLQLVYRGQLGFEEDDIVVATKDISEPTFYTYQNNTDYIYIHHDAALAECQSSHLCTLEQAEKLINENQAVADSIRPPGCVETRDGVKHLGQTCHHWPIRMRFSIGNGTMIDMPDPDLDTPDVDFDGKPVLKAGKFVRIAMLGEAGEFETIKRMPMTFVSGTCNLGGAPSVAEPQLYKWQLDYRPGDDTDQTYVGRYSLVRGVRQWRSDWCVTSADESGWDRIKDANFQVMAPFASMVPVQVKISQQ